MATPCTTLPTTRERGGITIMVVLMLLALLTISSLGMSRNAYRAAIGAGTLRQVAQAENLADAGIEWAIYWIAPDPNIPSVKATASGGALALQQAATALNQAGSYGTPSGLLSNADMTMSSTGGITQSFDVTVTLMGTVVPYFQGLTPNNSMVAQTLMLWAIRSNGHITYPNGTTYTHRREAWVTLPPSV